MEKKTMNEEKEIVCHVDVSSSMGEYADRTGSMTKQELAVRILHALMQYVWEKDAQGSDEKTLSGRPMSGLRTSVFSNRAVFIGTGHMRELYTDVPKGVDPEDFSGNINPQNERWMMEHIHWGGGTYLMPSVQLQEQHYRQEMIEEKQLPEEQLPTFLNWFITDGQATDEPRFRSWLKNQDPDKVLVGCIVLGYDQAYRDTVEQWSNIAKDHQNVKVWGFNGSVDPEQYARELIALAE